eukprot:3285555-Prymnesium_polylepis.1
MGKAEEGVAKWEENGGPQLEWREAAARVRGGSHARVLVHQVVVRLRDRRRDALVEGLVLLLPLGVVRRLLVLRLLSEPRAHVVHLPNMEPARCRPSESRDREREQRRRRRAGLGCAGVWVVISRVSHRSVVGQVVVRAGGGGLESLALRLVLLLDLLRTHRRTEGEPGVRRWRDGMLMRVQFEVASRLRLGFWLWLRLWLRASGFGLRLR